MILKDNDGDVGIALANWEGVVAGKPGVKGVAGKFWLIKSVRNEREAPPPSTTLTSLSPFVHLQRSKQGTDGSGWDSGSEGRPRTL